MCHVAKYSPAKTGKYRSYIPNFQNCPRHKKDLEDNKHNGLHLVWKYARIFVLGHYLFLKAHSLLKENCSLLGTDNFHGQIYTRAYFHAKWRPLFIQLSDPGQRKQLDLKSNELNNRLLGLSKNPPNGKVEVNSDWEGIFKSHKFKGEYKTEMELQPLPPPPTPPPPSLLVPKILF